MTAGRVRRWEAEPDHRAYITNAVQASRTAYKQTEPDTVTTRTPANTLLALAPYWNDIIRGAARAERNINEIQPGFPSTTPGNGSPGGGTGFNRNSITERQALKEQPDPAQTADQTITNCVRLINLELLRLHKVIVNWDYATAGEHQAGTNPRQGAPRDMNDYAEPGCKSCGREELMIWSPVHNNGMCRWCADVTRSEGFMPTPNMVRLHEEGRKMTRSIVDKEMKPLRDAARALASKTKQTRKPRKKAA